MNSVNFFAQKGHASPLFLASSYESLITMILHKTKRSIQEQFRRRTKSLLKKADELKRLCGAEVYLVIRRGGKFYTYSSLENSWPPSPETIVGTNKQLWRSYLTITKERKLPVTGDAYFLRNRRL